MGFFSNTYSQNDFVISLEFFPPKSPEGMDAAKRQIQLLTEMKPDFMTVTYGAGGGTREKTRQLTSFIHGELGEPVVAHLTCVGHSREEIADVVEQYKKSGVSNILALRGDPPVGEESFQAHPEGFSCARELVEFLKELGSLSLAVAGYPEVHPEAESRQTDLEYLKSKVDAGAEVVLTQLFFDPEMYLRFRDDASALGIEVPIVPGIMPVRNVSQLERFTEMCGASIPEPLHEKLLAIRDDEEGVRSFGQEYALEMCEKLKKEGAPGVHFYTLNQSKQVEWILPKLMKHV